MRCEWERRKYFYKVFFLNTDAYDFTMEHHNLAGDKFPKDITSESLKYSTNHLASCLGEI